MLNASRLVTIVAESECSSCPMQRKHRPDAHLVYIVLVLGLIVIVSYQYSWRSALSSKSRQPVSLPAKLEAPAPQGALPQRAGAAKHVSKPSSQRLPKLIHQTVRNSSKLTCQQRKVINSWKTLNPGYQYQLWDDSDIRGFILHHYPELVPIPFDEFLSGAERSDLWRVLVLHKLGGVYADMDVQCLKPIDEWNAEHGYDAQVLLGMENFDGQREHPIHVVNWVLAASPGHPLLGSMPSVVAKATQHQFYQVMKQTNPHAPAAEYEAGIIDRTGPAALSWAMYEYFNSIGQNMSTVTDMTVSSPEGFAAGGVRVLPVANMASGWEVAEARKQKVKYTCDDLAKRVPDAYVCHMFAGSWRAHWFYRSHDGDAACETADA